MTPQARAKAEAEALRLDGEMNLAEVRRALKLSQEEIAQTLQIGQGSVAKTEKRTSARCAASSKPWAASLKS